MNEKKKTKADIVGDPDNQPKIGSVKFDNIPELLRQFARWVCWRWSWNKKQSKWKKVPVNARTGKCANVGDPATWSSYDDAVAAMQSNPDWGIGFVLGTANEVATFTGIDLDECIEDGKVDDRATDIMQHIKSYAEYSPTGTGIKIICVGVKPDGACKSEDGKVEMYGKGRFFTITGDCIYKNLLERQPELTAVWEEWVKRPTTTDKEASGPDPTGEPELVFLKDADRNIVDWYWENRAAIGKLTLGIGDPGVNKSLLTIEMGARVARGESWSDTPDVAQHQGSALILSTEDGIEDTIAWRLDAAGGEGESDKGRIAVIRNPTMDLRSAEDLKKLERWIDEVGNLRLLTLDPITAFFPGTNTHRESDVRSATAPLIFLAQRKRFALFGIMHMNKKELSTVLYRAMGSIGWVAAARSVLLVSKYQSRDKRALISLKNNNGPIPDSLAFELEIDDHDYPRINWLDEPVVLTAREILEAESKIPGPNPEEREKAKTFLLDLLHAGPRLISEINELAKIKDIKPGTLGNAKRELGILKTGGGKFGAPGEWHLPFSVVG